MSRKLRSLADLGELKRVLDETARKDARLSAQAIEAARREDAEVRAFAHAVGPVTPLAGPPVREPRSAQPSPEPRQRQRDEQAALAATLSDEFDPTSLLHTDAELAFHRVGVGADVPARLRRGQWSIQRQLDLHGLTRDQARDALAAFLQQAERDGLRCVRIVHGKGNGSPGRESVLKAKVRSWLVQKSEVIAFAQARAADGGHGALLVLLRGTRA